jgi:DNA-binding GntR family transcriptional regulator
MAFFERLYAATERYRIPVLLNAGLPVSRDVQAEHGALAEATLDRDADKACALLTEHYLRTVEGLSDAIDRNKLTTVPAKAAAL